MSSDIVHYRVEFSVLLTISKYYLPWWLHKACYNSIGTEKSTKFTRKPCSRAKEGHLRTVQREAMHLRGQDL